jgi:hypothetical protein
VDRLSYLASNSHSVPYVHSSSFLDFYSLFMLKLTACCLDCFRKYQRRPFQRIWAGPPPRAYTFHCADPCAETIKQPQATVTGIKWVVFQEHTTVVRSQFDSRGYLIFAWVKRWNGQSSKLGVNGVLWFELYMDMFLKC